MFSKTVEYGFRAAVFLTEAKGERITAQEIAEATHVPTRYMSKVLQLLTEAGIIDSQRGPTGGFAFVGDPERVTLLDIVQAIDPIERITSCPLNLPEHAHALCPLHRQLDGLARTAMETLGQTSLRSVMQESVVPLGISITSFRKKGDDPESAS